MLRIIMIVILGYFAAPYIAEAIPGSFKSQISEWSGVQLSSANERLESEQASASWKELLPEEFRSKAMNSVETLTGGQAGSINDFDTQAQWFPDLRFEESTRVNNVGFRCDNKNSFAMSEEACFK